MIPPADWKPGDPLEADRLNERSHALDGALRLGADPAGGLGVAATPRGRVLRRNRRPPILGLLSGSSSPYTFVQRVEGPTGALVDGPLAGTAYEVNGVSGLGGLTVRLHPDRFGDWRFQDVAFGTTAATCTITVHVQDRGTSAPISGAAVTIRLRAGGGVGGTGPTLASGTTNAAGNFVATNPPSSLTPGLNYWAQVTYDGQLNGGTVHCGDTLGFSYCKAIATLTTEPDSVATFGTLTISPPPLEDLGGGVYRWTYRELRLTSSGSLLPAVAQIGSSKDGYVSRCVDVPLDCGDNVAMALPLYYYVTDYFVPNCGCPVAPCQDLGDAPDNAGIAPKVMQVRWSVLYQVDPGGPAAPGPLGTTSASVFGSNAETWIPITWDGVAGNGVNPTVGSTWDSGCLATDGKTITCPSGPPATRACASTRTRVQCDAGGSTFAATYLQYPAAACANTSPNCIGTITATGSHGAGDSGVCTPVTGSATLLIASGSTGGFAWAYYVNCELTE